MTNFYTGKIENGELKTTPIRSLPQSAMLACPFFIMVPSHYREDNSCKCDDPTERAVMIQEWGYTTDDFDSIPLAYIAPPPKGESP